jgi:carboxymethylenebutenolidase
MLARRAVLGTVARGLAALPLAAVLADPKLAAAAARELDEVSLTTPSGKTVFATVATPAETPAPAVLLVHEWWGLNDQIKAVAADLAREGYLALAVDLYDRHVATTPEDARTYMQQVNPAVATETLAAWIDWLGARADATGKIGVIGWCYGGGWSLNASLVRPVAATVVYYGRVDRTAADLASLKGPVLGHFATRDQRINRDMVGGFERAMDTAGKAYQDYWYEADHAFGNPTGARYDAGDAALAWQRTLAFFRTHLSSS